MLKVEPVGRARVVAVSFVAKTTPPGMPGSVSRSRCCSSVVLICNVASPASVIPYACRKLRFVATDTTPHSRAPPSPVSSTNFAAPAAMLPTGWMISTEPKASSWKRVRVPLESVTFPTSRLTPPRIAKTGDVIEMNGM